MCGIVGYVGNQDALGVILSGLERLEYRGYDSAGVAVVEGGDVSVTRARGKLIELKKAVQNRDPSLVAQLGIGHTRWATHGRPSEENAHPHTAGRISLIHNGIIENYIELRKELEAEGCEFKSETDTEIAAHLLNKFVQEGNTPFKALKLTCDRVRGSYAFLAIDADYPDRILIAKNATPIVIGLGEEEVFVASDIPAILPYTRRVVVLEDGDIAEVKVDTFAIENDGKRVDRPQELVTWDPITAQKGGFKHYMLKEIHDQIEVVAESFRGRIIASSERVALHDLSLDEAKIKGLSRIVFVACGTAWHACLSAKFYVERFAGIPCEVDYASEFRYRDAILDEKTLVIAVSQSGETADTLAAIEFATKTSPTLAVCNVVGSSLSRKVDDVIYTHAGPEISVASTKAFTTQLVTLYLLAVWLGQKREFITEIARTTGIDNLLHVPHALSECLKAEKTIEAIAKKYHRVQDFLFIGRGICYPIALEGALKLKEISYIHAEGYPAGELKHGPIALIDENMPVVVILQRQNPFFEKTLSNLREVESRGGRIIAVTDTVDNEELKDVAEDVIEVPFVSDAMSPLLLTIPLQLLSYYVAVYNGTDVDLPRNLAKSVTVE
jgi:glucosamine--fructose-6-phosphate aminotransferase (isomerizing)